MLQFQHVALISLNSFLIFTHPTRAMIAYVVNPRFTIQFY